MDLKKFLSEAACLEFDMFTKLKKRTLQSEYDIEDYHWVSDLAFIYACEQDDQVKEKLKLIQTDIKKRLNDRQDSSNAYMLLSLCGIAQFNGNIDKLKHLCKMYADTVNKPLTALWINAIGTAAVICHDSELICICIKKSHEYIAQYDYCYDRAIQTVWDEMSHIAHFNSVCMEYGYEKEELSYTFYSKLIKWYTQSLYNEKELKWFQIEDTGTYPDGDMLIHIASLPDSPYHSWLNRYKVLARYLFDSINLPNGYYGWYSVLNINNAAEECSPFEASLANLDMFWNNEIIVTDDQHEPKLKVYISPAGIIKAAYKGEIAYTHRTVPYNRVKYADILNGQRYVVCTECNDKEHCIYTIEPENESIWIEHKRSDETIKREKIEFTADISSKIQALKEGF